MLVIFFVYHMFMIKAGNTTNEKIKYSQVDWYLQKCEKFYEKWIEVKKAEIARIELAIDKDNGDEDSDEGESYEPKEDVCKYYGASPAWTMAQIQKRLKETKKDLERVEANPYRGEGFISNLKKVIWTAKP